MEPVSGVEPEIHAYQARVFPLALYRLERAAEVESAPQGLEDPWTTVIPGSRMVGSGGFEPPSQKTAAGLQPGALSRSATTPWSGTPVSIRLLRVGNAKMHLHTRTAQRHVLTEISRTDGTVAHRPLHPPAGPFVLLNESLLVKVAGVPGNDPGC
jgi:hypothetical protein